MYVKKSRQSNSNNTKSKYQYDVNYFLSSESLLDRTELNKPLKKRKLSPKNKIVQIKKDKIKNKDESTGLYT